MTRQAAAASKDSLMLRQIMMDIIFTRRCKDPKGTLLLLLLLLFFCSGS